MIRTDRILFLGAKVQQMNDARNNSVKVDEGDRVYISVLALVDKIGNITPESFVWTDGETYIIESIINARPTVKLGGGSGMRYLIKVDGKQSYLFYEEIKSVIRWFVVEKNKRI